MEQKPNRTQTRLYIKDKNGEWKEVQRVKEERTPQIPGLEDFAMALTTFPSATAQHEHQWVEQTQHDDLRRTFSCSCGAQQIQSRPLLQSDLPAAVRSFLDTL